MMFGKVASRSGRVTLTEVSRLEMDAAFEAEMLTGCCKLEKSCLGPGALPYIVRTVRLSGDSSLIWTVCSSSSTTSPSTAPSAEVSLLLVRGLRASSLAINVLALFWNARTLERSLISSKDDCAIADSLLSRGARTSSAAFSTSFSSASKDSYEPSCMSAAMVDVPSGGVSLARFNSDSPDAARVADEAMGRFSIEGSVS